MDNNVKFFWLMRKQALEEELNKCKKLQEMIQLSWEAWSDDLEAVKVATSLELKIKDLEEGINETPDLN